MYKCTECGKEFSTRQSYCDCGNDIFESIINEDVVVSKKKRGTFAYIQERLERKNMSLVSIGIFVACVFCSLIILCWKTELPQKDTLQQVEKKQQSVNLQIPPIDELWISTPPTYSSVKKEKAVVKPEVIGQNLNTSSSKTNKSAQISNTTKTVTTKTTNTTKAKTATSKNATNTQSSVKNQTTSSAKKVTETPKNLPKTQSATVTTKTTVKKTQQTVNVAELNNYKIGLRSVLFARLSVPAIQGSGKCGIEFSIDANGKLINRAFTFQSDNKSVNDEVYKMLMRLPVYKVPPKGYNGEKIKMTFTFDNGSYLIDFTN